MIVSQNLKRDIATAISECNHDRIFVLTDENVRDACWHVISSFHGMRAAELITVKATDRHKDIESLTHVWKALSDKGATRHSCMINLGGGMITDLGGFAASTFKRGIDYINIPTTLLGMVDASTGGKTGINFNGLKNEIGAFCEPKFVILDTVFLKTLSKEEIMSGYAEMIKHGLISNESTWAQLLKYEPELTDTAALQPMIVQSVEVKQRIVREDPFERGMRKALNFGHTFGHAFEEFASDRKTPVKHGYAVSYGMICELYLSIVKTDFPVDKARQTMNFIKQNYGRMEFTCDDYNTLTELMKHDKKNTSGAINVTLLSEIGKIKINQNITTDDINEALDFYREGC